MSSRLFKHQVAASISRPNTDAIYELLLAASSGTYSESYLVDTAKNTYTAKPAITFAAAHTYGQFSPDGNFYVAALSVAPWVQLYRRQADGTYVAQAMGGLAANVPSALATKALSFTADGKYLAMAIRNEAAVILFSLGAAKLTYNFHSKGVYGAVGTTQACCISPDGNYCVLSSSYETNRFYVFKWNGTAFVYLKFVLMGWSSIPYAEHFAWTSDSRYIFMVTALSTYSLLGFRRDGDVFTSVIQKDIGNGPRNVWISPDDQHVAVGGGNFTGTLVINYRWNNANNTLTQLTFSPPTGVVNSVSWTKDGSYCAVGWSSSLQNSQEVKMFKRLNDTYTPIATTVAADNSLNSVFALFRPVPGL